MKLYASQSTLLAVLATLTLTLSPGSFADDSPANKPIKPSKTKSGTTLLPLDTGASKITWNGKKVKGEHTGTVMFKEGKFEFKGGEMVGGTLVVDLTTITNTDLTDAEYNKKLVGHLKSDDFFAVEKFPTATFKIKSFKVMQTFAPGTPNAVAKGDLTIRGVTKPASVSLNYDAKENGFTAKGKLEIDRTQYGVKYNSKKFFSLEKLGDKLINDKFEIDLDIVAHKAAQ